MRSQYRKQCLYAGDVDRARRESFNSSVELSGHIGAGTSARGLPRHRSPMLTGDHHGRSTLLQPNRRRPLCIKYSAIGNGNGTGRRNAAATGLGAGFKFTSSSRLTVGCSDVIPS